MQINVHNYRQYLGRSVPNHNAWRDHIIPFIASAMPSMQGVDTVDVYNMGGCSVTGEAGHSRRMVIYGNAYRFRAPKPEEDYPYLNHRAETEAIVHIKDENGNVMAEYDTVFNELFILFDVFTGVDFARFDDIIEKLEAQYFYPKTLENSWLHTQNKDKLVKYLSDQMRNQRRDYIESEKRRIDEMKGGIDDMRRRIKQYLDNIERTNRYVLNEEQALDALGPQIMKDLDLIVAHEKVKDLHVKDGKFTVFTNPLCMYTKKDEKFYLGEMRIEMTPQNSDVRFFGSNTHPSYWTHNDPHPHVNGRDGHACLGNASALIAELSSQMQLYALTLTCIDFLEQANLDDIAGRNVYNWPRADEDGNPLVVEEAEDDRPICPRCDRRVTELHTVYRRIDEDGDVVGEHEVCEDCRDEYYHYEDDVEEYVADDAD